MAAAAPDISELLAALQGGGGETGMMPPASAPPTNGGGGEDEPIAILKEMLRLAHQYLEVEPDEEDKATMEAVSTMLQKYLAKDQQDAEKLMGGGALSRTLRKVG